MQSFIERILHLQETKKSAINTGDYNFKNVCLSMGWNEGFTLEN